MHMHLNSCRERKQDSDRPMDTSTDRDTHPCAHIPLSLAATQTRTLMTDTD